MKSAAVTDVPGVLLRLDEIARQVDDLPLANAVGPAAPSATRHAGAVAATPQPWWRRWLASVRRRGAVAGAREPHRPARGRAGGARPGLLPAREPEAAADERAAGAAGAADRCGARRRGHRLGGAEPVLRPGLAPHPGHGRARCSRCRRSCARWTCRASTRPSPRWRRPAPAAEGLPMRAALWLLVLFAVAAAVALFAGNNQGTVTVFWPPYRVDLSLNLVLLLLVAAFVFLHTALARAVGAVRPAASRRCAGAPSRRSAACTRRCSMRCRTCWPAATSAPASRPRRRWPRKPSLAAGGPAAGQRRRSCARWRTCWPPRARRRCRTAPRANEHLQSALEQATARDAQETHEGALMRAARWSLRGPRAAGRDQLAAGPAGRRQPAHAGAAHEAQGRAAGPPHRRRAGDRAAAGQAPRVLAGGGAAASCAAWRSTCSMAPTTRRSCSGPGPRWSRRSARCRSWPSMRPSAWSRWAATPTSRATGCCRSGSASRSWATA